MAVDLRSLLEKTQIIDISETNDKTCPICYEDYLQNISRGFPRKLTCGHTFGTECLLLWALSRTKTSSINSLICTRPIIYAIGVQYIRYAALEYVEEASVRAYSHYTILYAAVDRTVGERPFVMTLLTVIACIPDFYFRSRITGHPLGILLLCVSKSTQNRLAIPLYRNLSILLLGVAVLVGTLPNRNYGRIIFFHAISPFSSLLRNFC